MSSQTDIRPEIGKTVDRPYLDVLADVESALTAEGFGVLTRIDVRETLKKKLDVDFADYVILGACAPPLAHRALSAVPQVGVLLPCNVVVRDAGDGRTAIECINARMMAAILPGQEIEAVATEVAERLDRVLAAI